MDAVVAPCVSPLTGKGRFFVAKRFRCGAAVPPGARSTRSKRGGTSSCLNPVVAGRLRPPPPGRRGRLQTSPCVHQGRRSCPPDDDAAVVVAPRVDCAHRLEAHPGQLEPGPFARPPRPRNASHRRKSVPAIAQTAHKAAGGLAPPRWPKFVDIDWEKSASPRSCWSQGGRTRASRTSSTRPGRCVSTRGTLSSLMFWRASICSRPCLHDLSAWWIAINTMPPRSAGTAPVFELQITPCTED